VTGIISQQDHITGDLHYLLPSLRQFPAKGIDGANGLPQKNIVNK
jgi:hypothetical protein